MSPYSAAPDSAANLDERLENSELVAYARCPFPLPEGDDRRFLLGQQLGSASKNISYNPHTGQASGYRHRSRAEAERLRDLLAAFSTNVSAWLGAALPRYAASWQLDQASFRPEEEATRRLRVTARNDLLHVDSFPSRPTYGRRILRCFANLNPDEPRVWITSEPFGHLLARYGQEAGMPGGLDLVRRMQDQVLRLFRPGRRRRSAYDTFMLRFHDFLKRNDAFQERCAKRCWSFAPGSAWVVFTDAVSHAALRGRYALEHSYFVPIAALRHPEQAPLALLEAACGMRHLDAA